MFKVKHCIRHSEVDSFENGCQPSTARSTVQELHWSVEDAHTIIDLIRDHTGCDIDELTLNACDEPGRIDAQFLSTGHSIRKASLAEELAWRDGRRTLRLVTVSYYVLEVRTAELTKEWLQCPSKS